KERFAEYDNQKLYQYLESIDFESAKELHPNNRQRVLRAIEIFETTGHKKSDIVASQQHICLYNATFVGLTTEREILYNRINDRVDNMIINGLEKEVEMLYQKGYHSNLQSMKAIGYKEWFAYFEKNQTKEMTIELIKKNSRNYAKRQYTWFKNQMPVKWFTVNFDCFEKTVDEVINSMKD
ncbi:MAG: tRNA (adenosine(37)-N6)-dimethylallyltransferase MiaA, partial [Coprobacillaceae bacterium]